MTNIDLIEKNDLSEKANGGTEQMLRRVYSTLPRELLEEFQIIPTRVRDLKEDKYRIYYCHDLVGDNEVHNAFVDGGWHRFHKIVFVSNWQAQQFINQYQPFSVVIDLKNRVLDSLHFVKEKAFSLYDIVFYINITQHAVKNGELHGLRGYTHSNMRQEYSRAHCFYESAFTGHIRAGKKQKIAVWCKGNVVGNRVTQ